MNKFIRGFIVGGVYAICMNGLISWVYLKGKGNGRTEAYRDAANIVKNSIIKNMELDNTDLEEEI